MNLDEILRYLRATDEETLSELWARADTVRRECVGDAVHLRGLIEISNFCQANCAYCGIRAGNPLPVRYRMEISEILQQVKLAEKLGYGTVVLQAGESPGRLPAAWVTELLCAIREISSQAVTLSLGERPEKDYAAWRDAGANRYLLRFETGNAELFAKIHPGHPGLETRLLALKMLRSLGYELGSGIMIGIPGESWEDLAADILRFHSLNLDMIGVGPFLPHAQTPLGKQFIEKMVASQVPNDEMTTLKVIALTRLVRPYANIPSTTALATINMSGGYELGLSRGANIIMPNVTPAKYRELYEIYPAKTRTADAAEIFDQNLKKRILALGRKIGTGAGNSVNFSCYTDSKSDAR
ncbi:MAG: [FeFe] hydrogenase H-cluster radical SAM maturase HydE [Planctomycetia bacterium]|nr:[FeFe] hydrogenase H-cluster radical SAM maturase HydE [Planctomycetia bacterium]